MNALPQPFVDVELPLADRRDGKIRMSYELDRDHRLFVTTDRLSVFDVVVAGVPYKGQVLNQLAAWWFEQTADIVPNHVVGLPDPNLLIARTATPLLVEVVVRGYITGSTTTSLWHQYEQGTRSMYGYTFPEGLAKNTPLPEPVVTPTTKAAVGGHDEPLSCAEVTDSGLVGPDVWDDVMDAALATFRRGQQLAADAGLILADTKYEFGIDSDGNLLLIDEVHTPDSSRFWVAGSYDDRIAVGDEPESLDKEVVRLAFAEIGYRGQGDAPPLDHTVWEATSARYIDTFQRLTGRTFEPGEYPVPQRLRRWVHDHLERDA